jgi:hypothetical protein
MKYRRMGRRMYPVDERVLEYLSEESWGSPSTIASDHRIQQLDVDAGYIEQRCEQLAERKLIEPFVEGSDMYGITTWGLAYLRGDLDSGHLPRYPV